MHRDHPKGRRPPTCPGACSCTTVCGQAVIDGRVEIDWLAAARQYIAELAEPPMGGTVDMLLNMLVIENERLARRRATSEKEASDAR